MAMFHPTARGRLVMRDRPPDAGRGRCRADVARTQARAGRLPRCVQAMQDWTRAQGLQRGGSWRTATLALMAGRALPPRRRAIWRRGLLQSFPERRQRGWTCTFLAPAIASHHARHRAGLRHLPAPRRGPRAMAAALMRRIFRRTRTCAVVPKRELPIDTPAVAQTLGITFDIAPRPPLR